MRKWLVTVTFLREILVSAFSSSGIINITDIRDVVGQGPGGTASPLFCRKGMHY